jgi:uncharacterized membrane protein YgcG
MKRHLIGVAAAVLGTMLIGGVVVQTATAAPAPSTVTLPLFGAQLKLDIVNGPGGVLTSVTVTPAAGNVATKLDPHKVVFESANLTDPTGDPAKVVIKSRNGTQKISARAGSLADVAGPGSWVGDVFGTGNLTTVPFTIADVGGAPTITIGTMILAADVTVPVAPVVQTSSGDDDDEGVEQSARATIKFVNAPGGDQSRTLSINVKIEEDDGKAEAKLSISLGKIKGVEGMAVGTHTWIGVLCNNADASIAYTVLADGTLTLGAITPAGSTTSTDEGKTTVTFATGEQVRIKVKSDEGQMKVSVKERIRCDSADPTTNVSTSIADDNHDGNNHDGNNNRGGNNGGGNNGGGNNGGGNNGGGNNGGGHGDDDTTTSSSTPVPAP